jgi:hypothetical protein
MNIKHIINEEEYLNIKQAYFLFNHYLIGKSTYNTFYKKFIKYKVSKNLTGVIIGSVIYFPKSDFISFIETIKGW